MTLSECSSRFQTSGHACQDDLCKICTPTSEFASGFVFQSTRIAATSLTGSRRHTRSASAEVAPDPDGGFGWQIRFGPNVKEDTFAVVERCGQESRPTVAVYVSQHQPSEAERSRLNEGVVSCLDKLGISVEATDSALKKELVSQVNRSNQLTGTPEQQASADEALGCFGPWQARTLSPEPGIDTALRDWLKSH